jgi:hypothetical protein
MYSLGRKENSRPPYAKSFKLYAGGDKGKTSKLAFEKDNSQGELEDEL